MIVRLFKFIALLWYADEHGWPNPTPSTEDISMDEIHTLREKAEIDEIAAAFQNGFTNGNAAWEETPEYTRICSAKVLAAHSPSSLPVPAMKCSLSRWSGTETTLSALAPPTMCGGTRMGNAGLPEKTQEALVMGSRLRKTPKPPPNPTTLPAFVPLSPLDGEKRDEPEHRHGRSGEADCPSIAG